MYLGKAWIYNQCSCSMMATEPLGLDGPDVSNSCSTLSSSSESSSSSSSTGSEATLDKAAPAKSQDVESVEPVGEFDGGLSDLSWGCGSEDEASQGLSAADKDCTLYMLHVA